MARHPSLKHLFNPYLLKSIYGEESIPFGWMKLLVNPRRVLRYTFLRRLRVPIRPVPDMARGAELPNVNCLIRKTSVIYIRSSIGPHCDHSLTSSRIFLMTAQARRWRIFPCAMVQATTEINLNRRFPCPTHGLSECGTSLLSYVKHTPQFPTSRSAHIEHGDFAPPPSFKGWALVPRRIYRCH